MMVAPIDGSNDFTNLFDPNQPVQVRVNGRSWETQWNGQRYFIDWDLIALPEAISRGLEAIVGTKLRRCCVSWLAHVRPALTRLADAIPPEATDFGDISLGEWMTIWKRLLPGDRSLIRELYSRAVAACVLGARLEVYTQLCRWKARHDVKPLRFVTEWHPTRGAFDRGEEQSLRTWFDPHRTFDDPKHHAAFILAWVCFETLKRPRQILRMAANALVGIGEGSATRHWFVRVPKVKRQTGRAPELWPISVRLAYAIRMFSDRVEISELQHVHNRLIIWPRPAGSLPEISSAEAKANMQQLARLETLKSGRTGATLNLTPNRLRHTGATRLAAAGASVERIAEGLEHDDTGSARRYIDAIASDLIPALERADRNLGGVFGLLNDAYFKGRLSEELGEQTIYVPMSNAGSPCVVGSCARDMLKQGKCRRHPFHACYGCDLFVAWLESDHSRALEYVDGEIARWKAAAGHPARPRALSELQRLRAAVEECLRRISAERAKK